MKSRETLRGAIKMQEFDEANVNRVVVAERIDKPGFAELMLVSDTDGDFAPVWGFGGPMLSSTERVKERASAWFPNLPCTTVKISHITAEMSQEKAYSIIMGN